MNIDNKVILEYSQNLTVLYVEDDKVLRVRTAKLLENYFKKIDLAYDGKDGLEKYRAFKKETQFYYDIVISDIDIPKMNGIDMCKIIIHENDQQSIIFTTGFNEAEYLLDAIAIGVSGFLLKPIELEQLKNILYKTSKFISERHFIDSYYQNIEAINVKLIDKNKHVQECNHLDMIVNDLALNKNIIMNKWVNNDTVKLKLRKHVIDNDYFKTHFGEKVFDYFIGAVQGKNKVGNCPVIVTMLEFFKHKNLPLETVFVICVNFKNAITTYICHKYSFNSEFYHELSLILDKNFEGVITQYMSLKLASYEKKEEPVEIEIQKEETASKLIDYNDYVFEHDIYEMKELEVEIDNLVINVTMNTKKSLEDFSELGSKTKRYGRVLMSYPIFEKLGGSIEKLGNSFIENAQVLFDDTQKVVNISILVEGFVNDLIIWRKEIFENNIANADFLNDSFFSNVSTIIQYIEYDENAQYANNDDGMEFF